MNGTRKKNILSEVTQTPKDNCSMFSVMILEVNVDPKESCGYLVINQHRADGVKEGKPGSKCCYLESSIS